MSPLTTTPRDTAGVAVHPLLEALCGAAAFAVSVTTGDILGIGPDSPDAPPLRAVDIALYALVLGAAVALAVWLANRALARGPQAVERGAAGMALGAAVCVVAFWSGWPTVLGFVAATLAIEHRRQVGSFSPMTRAAAVTGTLAAASATVLCVIS